MIKKLVFSFLLIVAGLGSNKALAQKPPAFAIHISSPLGFIYKFGVTAEYRPYYDHGFLLSYTHYFDYYPGYQGAFEYRLYRNGRSSVHENIIYFKAGNGFADFNHAPSFVSSSDKNQAPGSYYFGGAGVGRHFNFGNFFLEVCAGLKYTYVARPPRDYDERLFYSIGPGSIPDVHFNFGLQL